MRSPKTHPDTSQSAGNLIGGGLYLRGSFKRIWKVDLVSWWCNSIWDFRSLLVRKNDYFPTQGPRPGTPEANIFATCADYPKHEPGSSEPLTFIQPTSNLIRLVVYDVYVLCSGSMLTQTTCPYYTFWVMIIKCPKQHHQAAPGCMTHLIAPSLKGRV